MKLILLNGPPRSGKDTAGDLLKEQLHRPDFPVETYKLAAILKEMVHKAYTPEGGPVPPHDAFEDSKDEPADFFQGQTPRKAYIQFSEHYIKPLYGQDYFGQRLAEVIREDGPAIAIVTDSGFAEEAKPLLDLLDTPKDGLQVHLHREGTSFDGDSRAYWRPRREWGNHRSGLPYTALPGTAIFNGSTPKRMVDDIAEVARRADFFLRRLTATLDSVDAPEPGPRCSLPPNLELQRVEAIELRRDLVWLWNRSGRPTFGYDSALDLTGQVGPGDLGSPYTDRTATG